VKEPEGWQLMTFGMVCGILGWLAIILVVAKFLLH
jgi:hypothetical protein